MRINDLQGGGRQVLEAFAQQSVLRYHGERTVRPGFAPHDVDGRRPTPSVDVPIPPHVARSPNFVHVGAAALRASEEVPEPSGDSARQECLLEASIGVREEYPYGSSLAGSSHDLQPIHDAPKSLNPRRVIHIERLEYERDLKSFVLEPREQCEQPRPVPVDRRKRAKMSG